MPAGMDVFARNVPERIMSVIVLGFAVIIFSSVLASATCLHSKQPRSIGGIAEVWSRAACCEHFCTLPKVSASMTALRNLQVDVTSASSINRVSKPGTIEDSLQPLTGGFEEAVLAAT